MSGPIERVVVVLDAAGEHRIVTETAARLAAHAKAVLHSIFVEDEDLLHLARLPFARQVTLGAPAEPMTTEHVELHLQVAAERARRELFAAAARHGVTYSFEIVRGAPESALTAVSERDLIVAGALTRPIGAHFRLECRWWSSIEVAPGPFLLSRNAWSASGSVVTLLDDRTAASARLLAAAAEIAQRADTVLMVLVSPEMVGTGFETWSAWATVRRGCRSRLCRPSRSPCAGGSVNSIAACWRSRPATPPVAPAGCANWSSALAATS